MADQSQRSRIEVRARRHGEAEWRRLFPAKIEAEAFASCRAAERPLLEGQAFIVQGTRVAPSARLRAWGPSAIDKGGEVTRTKGEHVWVRPLASTRPKDIGARGFGWLWSRKKEYHFTRDDLERAEPDTTGAILRRLNYVA